MTETNASGAQIPCISLLDRWRYIKADPHGARALLLLLEHGKGTPDDFDTMVNRIILSMVGEGLFKLSMSATKPYPAPACKEPMNNETSDGGETVPCISLLDVPPSNGYGATVNLRWVRSAKYGGTVLAQKYTSAYVGEDDVWCPIQHGLPDTSNASSVLCEPDGWS